MSSQSKRRLSNGGNLLGAIVDDEEEQVFRSNSRRRSSTGSKGKGSATRKSPNRDPEKQQRLAQMYSRIIQMSTENVS
jgi:hypothetical protein